MTRFDLEEASGLHALGETLSSAWDRMRSLRRSSPNSPEHRIAERAFELIEAAHQALGREIEEEMQQRAEHKKEAA